VLVSAKTGQGLDDLFDMVNLVADLQELKADPKREAIGTIIEAELDKGRGPVATVVVQTGTLRIGNIVVVGKTYGKVKALENAAGKRIQKAGPSSAALVLGLGEVPEAGDILRVVPDEKTARSIVEQVRNAAVAQTGTSQKATLEDLFNQFQEGQSKELRIILKADVSGSLGAITHALGQIISDEVRISVLHEGTGDITDNDILLASASNAIVVGFNTKLDPQARRTAEAEKVACTTSSISSPTTSKPPSRECSSRRSWSRWRDARRFARSSGWARARSSPDPSSPTATSRAPRVSGSIATAS